MNNPDPFVENWIAVLNGQLDKIERDMAKLNAQLHGIIELRQVLEKQFQNGKHGAPPPEKMNEPMKGFNAAQRAHDAQEPPEYYAKPRADCPHCRADEAMEIIKVGGELMGDPWTLSRCSECGHEEKRYRS